MKPALTLTFLLAAPALADLDHIFYVQIYREFVTLTNQDFLDRDNPISSSEMATSAPVFTLDGNIAYTGNDNNRKYLGYENGVMVLGSRDKVEPLKLQMNWLSKVLNIPFMWKPFKTDECSKAEIYLLSPIKVFSKYHDSVDVYE